MPDRRITLGLLAAITAVAVAVGAAELLSTVSWGDLADWFG